jgi:CubicO group peptidase (beta-lactamase class C family)
LKGPLKPEPLGAAVETVERFVIEQLAAWEVPGCAVAAVRDGRVELAGGWGRRDREAGLPVTEDTLFAIGSVTKAFTATAIGALVDEGLLEWDRPLRDYVPGIRLHDPFVSDRLTIVDLLSHRSGLPRHDLTWIGQPGRSRAEIVRSLRFLPLSRDLRQAGAINSTAAEMARWLLVQLAGGQLDGATVMSAGTAKRQLTPQMLTPGDGDIPGLTQYAYGLGWSIGRYREHAVATHAGGIDGFTTQCMLLPDDGIGVVVLTNTSASLLPLVVACRVLDELLGAEPLDVFSVLKPLFDAVMAGVGEAKAARRVVPSAPPARPLSAYAGQYEHPGYGTLAIALDRDTLKPSLGTMDLSLEHRHYETFDLTWNEVGDQPVVFPLTSLSDPDGDVNGLTVGFEPLVEPLRFGRRADAQSPEVLRGLCGTYAMGPIELVVAMRGERTLTVTAPGSPPLDLEPIGGLRFGVQDQPAVTAEFETDGNGAVTRLIAQPLGIFLPKEVS